jgi:4-alpha-glucanotransferase
MSRQAGILLPLFSLRSGSDWGVGEIPDLLPWARWCSAAGFSVAQVLPVNEASRGQSSPYGALSAFAIDPVYVGVEALEDFDAAGGVSALPDPDRAKLEAVRAAPAVRWGDVRALKARALGLAFERFVRDEWRTRSERARALEAFAQQEAGWLDVYALFVALHDGEMEGLFDRYQTHRKLTVTFEDAGEHPVPAGCALVERTPNRLTLLAEKARARDIVRDLFLESDVVDVEIGEEDIGSVVERIYSA